jgi:hypothetical protein
MTKGKKVIDKKKAFVATQTKNKKWNNMKRY